MTTMKADHAEDIRELNDNQAAHSRILKNMWEHFDKRFDTLEERLNKRLDAKIDSVLKRLPPPPLP